MIIQYVAVYRQVSTEAHELIFVLQSHNIIIYYLIFFFIIDLIAAVSYTVRLCSIRVTRLVLLGLLSRTPCILLSN